MRVHRFTSGLIPCLVFCFGDCGQAAGYGDPVDGLPSWKGRGVQVLTNACRVAPTAYRDRFLPGAAIFNTSTYTAVPPLYFSLGLNRAGRFHLEDLASCGKFQHNSCDGTDPWTRIRRYYDGNPTGENLATGTTDALRTVNLWIMDAGPGGPAPDGSGDGHRMNIMASQAKEIGCDYAAGSSYPHLWIQDFGGGAIDTQNPIAGGTHLFLTDGKTTFLVSFFDPSGKSPTKSSLVLEGSNVPLALSLGTGSRGIYEATLDRGSGCRRYHFSFTDGSGAPWRYPENGDLITTGEGACTEEYIQGGAGQRPGDCNQDGALDISDSICLLGFLFLGEPGSLPCGSGSARDPENIALLNVNADLGVDLSDGIYILAFLFQGGAPPAAGTACIEISGCAGPCPPH